MRFNRIRSVVLFCAELKKAAKFYEDLLGVAPYRSDKDFVGFHLDGFDLCFHRQDEKSAPQSGSQVVYFIVDDLSEAMKELKTLGCEVHRRPIDIPEGGRVAQLRDPFGNIIGLMEKA